MPRQKRKRKRKGKKGDREIESERKGDENMERGDMRGGLIRTPIHLHAIYIVFTFTNGLKRS